MKINKIKEELKSLSAQEQVARADAFRRERFSLRLNSLSVPVKDYSQFSKLRKNVARALTYARAQTLLK